MRPNGMRGRVARGAMTTVGWMRGALFAAVSFAVMIPSCADKKSTAIVVAITTESKVPDDLAELAIDVRRAGAERFETTYVMPSDGRLPGTLTLSDDDGNNVGDSMTVRVRARATGSTEWLVVREAVLGFSKEKTKLLRMPLRYSCFAFGCPEGKTCIGGECKSPIVDVASLPDFVGDEQVFPRANTCFSTSRCLGAPTSISSFNNCSFAMPAAAGKFNVIVTYLAAPDRPVVVEQDPKEGFSIQGGQVVLSKGLCDAVNSNVIVGVATSTRCSTKSADAALCDKAFVQCSEEGEECSTASDCCGNNDGGIGCSRFGSTTAPAVCTAHCTVATDCNSGCCVDTNVAGEKVCAPVEYCGGGTAGTGGTGGAAGAGGGP